MELGSYLNVPIERVSDNALGRFHIISGETGDYLGFQTTNGPDQLLGQVIDRKTGVIQLFGGPLATINHAEIIGPPKPVIQIAFEHTVYLGPTCATHPENGLFVFGSLA